MPCGVRSSKRDTWSPVSFSSAAKPCGLYKIRTHKLPYKLDCCEKMGLNLGLLRERVLYTKCKGESGFNVNSCFLGGNRQPNAKSGCRVEPFCLEMVPNIPDI